MILETVPDPLYRFWHSCTQQAPTVGMPPTPPALSVAQWREYLFQNGTCQQWVL